MIKRLSHDEIKQKIKTEHPAISFPDFDYKGSLTRVNCTCNACGHFWTPTVSNLFQGYDCVKCANIRIHNATRIPQQEIERRIKEIQPTIYIGEFCYENNKMKIPCKCITCEHEWNPTIISLIHHKYGCPRCSGKYSPTPEEAKQKIESTNPNITVLECDYKNIYSKIKCQCNTCSHVWSARYNNLFSSNTGCPICFTNKMSRNMREFLTKSGIDFIQEYRFPDCKHIRTLPFDFYLPKLNTCIEIQGGQHFFPVKHWGGKETFNKTTTRDKIKKDYCDSNGIKLIYVSNEKLGRDKCLNFEDFCSSF